MKKLWAPWRIGYVSNCDDRKVCFLCTAAAEREDEKNLVLRRGAHCMAILNRFPYNNGHVLVAPYAHKADLPELTADELDEMVRLTLEVQAALKATLKPQGFNVGFNIGAAAGAGVPGHIHGHIVPRWTGDTSFVTTLADVKVLSQSLEESYKMLVGYFGGTEGVREAKPGKMNGDILSTDAIAAREETMLAPYAMKSRNSKGRVHDEAEAGYRGAYRGLYQRDRDRIIHCTAFRRLEYKTQVFVNHEGDNYRTRLTHTMEVTQISRGIARALRLNEDLTEAVALAHDLGHTPFGHSGEDALRELMAEHGGFEHNTHGLRIVEKLERRYPNFPGLNLSYEIRESIAKHATRHDNPTPAGFDHSTQALLEAQVVDAADEIAYDNHDIEDGLLAGILDIKQLVQLSVWQMAAGRAKAAFKDVEVRPSQIVTFLINILVNDLLQNSVERIQRSGIGSAAEAQAWPERLIGFSDSMKPAKKELEDFLYQNLYRHYRVQRMANKAKRFVIEMFEEYTREPNQLPPYDQRRIEEEVAGGLTQGDAVARALCDYIAGMTDRFAQEEYMRLFYPFERV